MSMVHWRGETPDLVELLLVELIVVRFVVAQGQGVVHVVVVAVQGGG